LPPFKNIQVKIFTTKAGLQEYLNERRDLGKKIALVPTMGALHAGHLSLLETGKKMSDEVVCSIFVNPTQFNDPKDLELYPRPIESDIEKLNQGGCDVLFNPTVEEMYPGKEHWHLDIGYLETVMEGKFRPGHYQGVTQIVFKLFDLVKPDVALFGQKDYQQVLVIKKMVQLLHMPVNVVMCPIVREEGGLAMSSRNVRLSKDEVGIALHLSRTLQTVKEQCPQQSIEQLRNTGTNLLSAVTGLRLIYFEILDAETLHPVTEVTKSLVALVAAVVGNTRLIDNIILT